MDGISRRGPRSLSSKLRESVARFIPNDRTSPPRWGHGRLRLASPGRVDKRGRCQLLMTPVHQRCPRRHWTQTGIVHTVLPKGVDRSLIQRRPSVPTGSRLMASQDRKRQDRSVRCAERRPRRAWRWPSCGLIGLHLNSPWNSGAHWRAKHLTHLPNHAKLSSIGRPLKECQFVSP